MRKDDEILEELRRIRTVLEPKPAPRKGVWAEFMEFISKYKLMGLVVAFILGMYLGALVQVLVANLIMPIITLVLPRVYRWTYKSCLQSSR